VTALVAYPVWKTTPGYRTFVVGGGAVRFECPESWIVAPTFRYVCVFDREPPDDRVLLALSWRRVSLGASCMSLTRVLEDLVCAGTRKIVARGRVIRISRPPLEMAWVELRFVEPSAGREGSTRLCLARSGCTQALAAFDFRPEDGRALFGPWNNFLETMAVGETIADAASGRRRERWG
jgi:hypothetical protein